MKVAYYSPLPPERTGVADYSALLLPALQRRLDVVPIGGRRRRRPRDADLSVYHVGNDPEAHGWIVEALRARPGVVVLHEFVLHHLVAGMTLARRDVASYLAAMEAEAGLAGRLLALGVVDGCIPPLWETRPEEFPLAGPILEASEGRGLVVHSRYVEERARELGYRGPIWRIPHPAWPTADTAPADLGRGPLIGCLGHLNPTKRIPQLLDAFALLRANRPDARLLLVGQVAGLDLAGRVADLALADAVIHEGYVPEDRLWSLMAACDVCVSLRAPTMGETSGSAIRALSLGKPLVVSDLGWFSELPDAVAVKVPVDEREVEMLAAALELLVSREDVRTAAGRAAREYAEREHGLERVADLYAAALEEAAGGDVVRDAVFHEVAAAASDVGIAPESREADEIAVALREARIGE